MITFIAFVVVIGLLVFVHEFGHFIMARRKGVRVDEFAFGFPPRIWSKKKGDTLYAINAIPFGGYVKLYGEHEEDKDNPESLAAKSKKDKSLIIVAGVVMNLLLAFVLLTILYLVGFKALLPGMANHKGIVNEQKVIVDDVQKDSPAQTEDLRKGDVITKVEGQSVYIGSEVLSLITEKSKGNEKVSVEIERGGEKLNKNLKTFDDKIKSGNKEVPVKRIGISLQTEGKISAPFYLAPVIAVQETYRLTALTFTGIFDFFGQLITKLTLSENVGGPVEIVNLTGAFAKMGILPLIQFTAILSISLAVINIMPIPALDGGHLLFLALEKIFGRDISSRLKNSVTFIGFVLLMLLIVTLTVRGLLNLR